MSRRIVASSRDSAELVEVLAQAVADLALDLVGVLDQAVEGPHSPSHFAAVFGPTFGTPGMLSEVSPTSAR